MNYKTNKLIVLDTLSLREVQDSNVSMSKRSTLFPPNHHLPLKVMGSAGLRTLVQLTEYMSVLLCFFFFFIKKNTLKNFVKAAKRQNLRNKITG